MAGDEKPWSVMKNKKGLLESRLEFHHHEKQQKSTAFETE